MNFSSSFERDKLRELGSARLRSAQQEMHCYNIAGAFQFTIDSILGITGIEQERS